MLYILRAAHNIHVTQDDIEHQEKADRIVQVVLSILDKNRDEKVSVEELQAAGLAGLPTFDDLGAEGHHYDVESGSSLQWYSRPIHLTLTPLAEFFLHHEGDLQSIHLGG
jgi:hypothetical protein